MIHAFTTTYTSIANQLRNKVTIWPHNGTRTQKEAVAVWDTGAMGTTISRNVADDLKLAEVSYTYVSTPAGISRTPRYYADILLPNGAIVEKVLVLEGQLIDFDILIGMDIINLGDFAVSNFNGKTVFSFRMPSLVTFDFVNNAYL